MPLLGPASEHLWCLKNYDLVGVIRIIPFAAEGMDDEWWSNFINTVSHAVLESGIFGNTILSFNVSTRAYAPKEDGNERQNILLRRNVRREYYIGIRMPSFLRKVRDSELHELYVKHVQDCELKLNSLRQILADFANDVSVLTYKQIFQCWYAILNGIEDYELDIIDNPTTYKPSMKTLSEQLLISPFDDSRVEYAIYNKSYYQVFSLSSFKHDFHASILWQILSQISGTYRYQINVYIPDNQLQKEKELYNIKSFAKFLALGESKSHNLLKAKSIEDFVQYVSQNNYAILDYYGVLVLQGRDPNEIIEKSKKAEVAFSSAGIFLHDEFVFRPQAFFNWSLPGLSGYAFDNLRYTTCSRNLAHLLPITGSFKGETDNPVLYLETRYGEIGGLTLFSEKQNKWGGLIVAPSGSGKTFLMNNLIYYHLLSDSPPLVTIVDMSLRPSYEALTRFLDGTALFIDTSARHAINPFEFPFPYDKPPERHFAFLEMFFKQIFNVDDVLKLRFLDRAMRKLYKVFLSQERRPKRIRITDKVPSKEFYRFDTWYEAFLYFRKMFAQVCKKEYYWYARYCHVNMMPTLDDLFYLLSRDQTLLSTEEDKRIANKLRKVLESILDSLAGVIFNRVSTFRITERSLKYYYLGGLIKYPDILSTVFLVVSNFIFEENFINDQDMELYRQYIPSYLVDRVRNQKKLILFDEMQNLGDSPLCFSEVERYYRQGRTLDIGAYAIFQSLQYPARSELGRSMIENAAMKIFLQHSTPVNPNKMAIDFIAEALGLNKAQKEMLTSLRKTNEYSELLVMSEGLGSGVLRFVPTGKERWIGTTHNKECDYRHRLFEYISQQCKDKTQAMRQTLDILAEHYPRGIVHEQNVKSVETLFHAMD